VKKVYSDIKYGSLTMHEYSKHLRNKKKKRHEQASKRAAEIAKNEEEEPLSRR
jgi:hypothetical protein